MKKPCPICGLRDNSCLRVHPLALRALVRAAVKQEPCGDPAYGGDLHRRALETNAATRRWLAEKSKEARHG